MRSNISMKLLIFYLNLNLLECPERRTGHLVSLSSVIPLMDKHMTPRSVHSAKVNGRRSDGCGNPEITQARARNDGGEIHRTTQKETLF